MTIPSRSKVFGGVFVSSRCFLNFLCCCRGFSHRTESDLFLFLFQLYSWWLINVQADWIPTVGLPRNRHFLGFSNVPVQTPTGDSPFYSYSEKPLHFSRLLRHAFGYGEPYLNRTRSCIIQVYYFYLKLTWKVINHWRRQPYFFLANFFPREGPGC